MADSWQSCFWRNLTTSYMATAIRIGTGLLLFPILFRHLTREQFGFWSLLWGIVTYTVLMDFGIGSTARVEVAKRAGRGDWHDLNRLLSTMFWCYVAVFAIVEMGVLALRPMALEWIKAGDDPQFSNAYVIFSVAISISVPMGLFFEILRGLQRMDLVSVWWSRGQLANLFGLSTGVWLGWRFDVLVLVSVLATVMPVLGGWFELRRLVPQLSLDPRLCRIASLRPVLTFSIIAYLLSVAALVIARTDQVVISLCLGVSTVAIYQAGFKVAEVYAFGLTQLSDLLSPAAAQSTGGRRHEETVQLLASSTRLSALMGIPVFVLSLLFLEPLIHLLTGLSPVPPVYQAVGIALLVARFSTLLTHSCASPIFLGAGWERRLLYMTTAEAVLNLTLSVILARTLGVTGVALGTMLPAVLIGWLWAVPLTLHFTGSTLSGWMSRVYGPILMPVGAAVCAALLGAVLTQPMAGRHDVIRMLLIGATSLVPVAVSLRGHLRRGLWTNDGEPVAPLACQQPA